LEKKSTPGVKNPDGIMQSLDYGGASGECPVLKGMRSYNSWFGISIAITIFWPLLPTWWQQFRRNLPIAVFH
jgi:hypothetical protein